MKKALILHSPYAGRSDRLVHALTLLQQVGIDTSDTRSIDSLDGLPVQGSLWSKQGFELVIAAGGDGLVGGVITHIAESDLPLGILPLGTSNDVARSLGISQDLEQAVEIIARGKQTLIDIAVARPAQQAPRDGSDTRTRQVSTPLPRDVHGYFAHALTLGINVEFARQATNIVTRQRFGHLTYPFAALEVLKNHHPLPIELRLKGLVAAPTVADQQPLAAHEQDEITYYGNVLQVSVINAPLFGGAWQLTVPGASLYDRLLDIIVIEDVDLARLSDEIARLFRRPVERSPQVPPALSSLQRAELTGIPGIRHVRARALVISTAHDPQDITLDGEVRGQTPTYVRMADKQLAVFTRR